MKKYRKGMSTTEFMQLVNENNKEIIQAHIDNGEDTIPILTKDLNIERVEILDAMADVHKTDQMIEDRKKKEDKQ